MLDSHQLTPGGIFVKFEYFEQKGAKLIPVVLVSVPFAGLLLLAIAALTGGLRPGDGFALIFMSIIALGAALASLSKVHPAPFILYGSIVVAFFGHFGIGKAFVLLNETAAAQAAAGEGSGTGWLIVIFCIAAGIAFLRQGSFSQDWAMAPIPLWAWGELQRYFKDSHGVVRKVLIAAALLVVAFLAIGYAVPGSPGEAQSSLSRYLSAAIVVFLVVISAGLLATSLTIPDDEIPEEPEPEEPEPE